MANKKISELPSHTLPYKDDLFVIVDSTSIVTKKITLENIMASPGNIGTLNPASGRFTNIQLPGDTEITASPSTGTLTISTPNNQLLLLGDTASILGIAAETCLKIDEENKQVSIRVSGQDQVLVGESEATIYGNLTLSGGLSVTSLDVEPSAKDSVVFSTKSLRSTAVLGDELVSNGDFSTDPDTSWTWGNGWTHDTTNHEADHMTGYTDPLTQDITVTSGETYQIEFTIKNRTAGSVSIDVGSVHIYNYENVALFSDNHVYKQSFVANVSGTATLSITPTSDFDGSITDITVKQIVGTSQPNVVWYDEQGNMFGEVRGEHSLNNLFIGCDAGCNSTTGSGNTFLGYGTGYKNATGSNNTFLGCYAGHSNVSGSSNTFLGYFTGSNNTIGYENTFVGYIAGATNMTGSRNTFLGVGAGFVNTTGSTNTFLGFAAGDHNMTGQSNTFIGCAAGSTNTSGSGNTFIGCAAGYNDNQKVDAVNSTAIGYNTYTTKDNQVVIGNTDVTETLLRGNVGINTDQFGSGAKVLALGNATTLPSANPVDAVILFAKDFDDGDGSATSELFVRDEDGNETNLSPHAIELYQPASDDPLPFTYSSTNYLIGKKINVDLSGAIRELERLTGKQFIYVTDVSKVSVDKYLETKKELLIKKYQEENAIEVEITLEEAVEEVEVEVDDLENVVGENVRYRFENGKIIQQNIPVYSKKKETRKQLKQGVRFDEQTGKFYKKVLPTREEAEQAVANSPKLKLRRWILDRIEKEKK